ncbi:MAG: hypothetical protein IJS93_00265 [Clostridia bacterium]|nr:hypothetical protein [Clostridia bacterium]
MFLAIDLEACNKYVKGSVFSIGVVGADDNFNVLFKRDIIINPHCKFCTNFRKPIEFSVSKEDVKNAPDIRALYGEIKQLLYGDGNTDIVILAHSANNDVFMLNMALKRAGLPPLKYRYICTQMIYSAVFDVMDGVGLDRAAKEMNIDFIHHKADEDAEMALEILKECCAKMECTYPELEEKLGIVRGECDNYDYTQMRCAKLEKLRNKHKVEKRNEQKRLRADAMGQNGVIASVDCKTFDLLRLDGESSLLTINDKYVSLLKEGDVIFVRKEQGYRELFKVRIVDIKRYDSFLDVYLSGENNVKNEPMLDFLTRTYDFNDYKREEDYGVARLTVVKIQK